MKHGPHVGLIKILTVFIFQEHTDWIPLPLFYAICDCKLVHYEYKCLEPLLALIGIIREDGQIHYGAFLTLADINTSVPEIIKIDGKQNTFSNLCTLQNICFYIDVPKKNQYYTTMNNEAVCDYVKMDNSGKTFYRRRIFLLF